MDLRQEMDTMLKKYGKPILLVRAKARTQCVCYTQTYGAKKDCPICLGSGYLYKAEKHIARDNGAAIPETLPRMLRDSNIGEVMVPSRMYYLKDDVRPDVEDLIIDCEWNKFGNPVFDEYSGVYKVNYPEPFRGDLGRIEYFRAACKYDPVSITGIKAYLAKKANVITYNIAIGGL